MRGFLHFEIFLAVEVRSPFKFLSVEFYEWSSTTRSGRLQLIFCRFQGSVVTLSAANFLRTIPKIAVEQNNQIRERSTGLLLLLCN